MEEKKREILKKFVDKFDIQSLRKIFHKTNNVKNFYRENGVWKLKNEK